MFNIRPYENRSDKPSPKDKEEKKKKKDPSVINLREDKDSKQEKSDMQSEGGNN